MRVCVTHTHTQTHTRELFPPSLSLDVDFSLFFPSFFSFHVFLYCCSVRTAPLYMCPHTDIYVSQKKKEPPGGARRMLTYAGVC